MKIYGRNKPIYVQYSIWDDVECCYINKKIEVENSKFRHEIIIQAEDYNRIIKKVETVDSIPSKSKLCFHPTSKFPRYKLEITDFERKVKQDKADYIVISTDIKYAKGFDYMVYESDTEIVLLYDYHEEIRGYNYWQNGYYLINDSTYSLIAEIENGFTKPLISDCTLNKICDSNLPDLTVSDVKQIYSMIQSKEIDTRELGLKLLSGFNISKYPFTSKCLIGLTILTGIKRNVAIKNLLDSVIPTHIPTSYSLTSAFYLNSLVTDNYDNSYSDEDVNLGKYLINYHIKVKDLARNFYYMSNYSWYDKMFKE